MGWPASHFQPYGYVANTFRVFGSDFFSNDQYSLAQLHVEFYLVIYPWAETLEFGQQIFSWSNFGKQICENSRCTLIDTIPNFEKYKENNKSWSSDLYFINDEHFNEGGARLLYESVINKIN